jgi:amidase
MNLMNLREYASYDGLGLAELVRKRDVTPKELAATAASAIAAVNPTVNAVIETYDDRIAGLDEANLGDGPFRGVPFLIKDVGGHERGRKIENGSRLCQGMIGIGDSNVLTLLRASGVNVLGRSNAPEYSIAGTTENALYGNTSTPWRHGYSAGGSTGGGAAAVAAGMVPVAHGSDIGGSIRIPASWCGGVGLKPSRGRVSFGPALDEGGFGLAMNFVQTKTVRDVAAMLDCLAIPQPGDPFVIPRPAEPYRAFVSRPAPRLRIAWSAKPLMDGPVDPEVAAAVAATARLLAEMGHEVSEDSLPFDGEEASRQMLSLWFFGFDRRLEEIAARLGRTIGPHTLEPVTLKIYEFSKRLDPNSFQNVLGYMNGLRRRMGEFFARHDVWVSPTTALVAEPHGLYNQGRADISAEDFLPFSDRPVQFCFPYNVAGQPAISLPLAWDSNNLPIGVQLGARPAEEHVLIQLAAALEEARPWRNKVPPLHASR